MLKRIKVIARNKYVLNSSYLFSSQILIKFITLSFTIVLARKVGLTDIGVYYFIVAFAGFFLFMADAGINQVIFRELSKRYNNEEIFNRALSLSLITLSLSILIYYLVVSFFSPLELMYNNVAVILGTSILSRNILGLYGTIYKSYERADIQAVMTTIEQLSFSLVSIVFLVLGFGLYAVTIIHAVITISLIAINYVVVKRYFFSPKLMYDMRGYMVLLNESYPYGFSVAFERLNTRVDSIMLTYLITPEATAIYNIGKRGYIFVGKLPRIIKTVVFPKMTRMYERDKKNYQLKFNFMIRFFCIMSVFSVAPLFLFADNIVVLLFGEQYENSGSVFKIMSLAVVFLFMQYIFGTTVVIVKDRMGYLVPLLISAFSNLLLNYILIPEYEYNGAAMSALISMLILIIGWGYVVIVKHGTKVDNIKGNLVFWSSFMILLLYAAFSQQDIIYQVFVLVIYAALYLAYMVHSNDFRMFRKLIG